MRFAIAANAKEMPAPSSAPAARISTSRSCAAARTTKEAEVSAAPIASTARKPMRVPSSPASAPVSELRDRGGQQQQARRP